TGPDQSYVDGRGRMQGHVLKAVIEADSQQAEERVAPPARPETTPFLENPEPERQQDNECDRPPEEIQGDGRHQVTDQPAYHRIARPKKGGNKQKQDSRRTNFGIHVTEKRVKK